MALVHGWPGFCQANGTMFFSWSAQIAVDFYLGTTASAVLEVIEDHLDLVIDPPRQVERWA
jgi:hypothetical protein